MTAIDRAKNNSCIGKFPHHSKSDADKQAARRDFLQSYRCSFCANWHVGHTAPASVKESWRKNAKRLKEQTA